MVSGRLCEICAGGKRRRKSNGVLWLEEYA